MERDWYLSLRGRYEPERLRLVMVAESPPVSGRYFYNADGSTSEPLFAAIMRHLSLSPSKDAGLLRPRGLSPRLRNFAFSPRSYRGIAKKTKHLSAAEAEEWKAYAVVEGLGARWG